MYFGKNCVFLFLLVSLSFVQIAFSKEILEPIKLPEPNKTGGMPLLDALAKRHSTRSFSGKKLSRQILSDLLWAAFGVNRSDGRRTAPSMGNWRVTDVYVALEEGLFLYDAPANTLQPVLKEDIRKLTGTQDFVGQEAVDLIYVANLERIPEKLRGEPAVSTAIADSGFIGENVYLFCTSTGLGCVVRRLIDIETLRKKMELTENQRIILSHSVGYPDN